MTSAKEGLFLLSFVGCCLLPRFRSILLCGDALALIQGTPGALFRPSRDLIRALRYGTNDLPFRLVALHQLVCIRYLLERKNLLYENLETAILELRQRMVH